MMRISDYGRCGNCGGTVARGTRICPHCGVRLIGEKYESPKKGKSDDHSNALLVTAIIISIVLEYLFLYPRFPNILNALLIYIIVTVILVVFIGGILLAIFD